MGRRQQGLSLLGLITTLFVLGVLALFAMRIIPSFLEFRTAKTAIERIAPTVQNPAEARRAFENRAAITREGNQLVIAFAYRKEVRLFGPVGLYIDYAANSKGQ
jgi:hypothetical protein